MKQLTSEQVSLFAQAMEIALKAGMPIDDALQYIHEDAQGALKEAIAQLQIAFQQTHRLAKAMKDIDAFPAYACTLCESGETCGCLDQVMSALALYYERDQELSDQIHQACLYPFLLVLLLFLVMGILIVKVLPIFQDVLHSLGSELSGFALMLMQAGTTLATLGILLLGCLLGLIFLLFALQKSNKAFALPKLLARLPLTKHLFHHIAMAQLTYLFSMYITSGIELEDAMPAMTEFMVHPNIKEKMKRCTVELHEKQIPIIQSFRASELYHGMEMGMLEIAQGSGCLDEVMEDLAKKYEKQVDQDITDFLNVLEPTILATLSVFVGLVLLSVMLPLMSIMSAL